MIFATFIIALLCGMGLGSGGLFVVYLTVFLGYEQLLAQGLNLYFFIFATATAMIVHMRTRKLNVKRFLYLCAFGTLGCIFGAVLAQHLGGGVLRNIFAWLLILSGVVSLFGIKKNTPAKK